MKCSECRYWDRELVIFNPGFTDWHPCDLSGEKGSKFAGEPSLLAPVLTAPNFGCVDFKLRKETE